MYNKWSGADICYRDLELCVSRAGMLPGAATPPKVHTLRPEVGMCKFQFPLRQLGCAMTIKASLRHAWNNASCADWMRRGKMAWVLTLHIRGIS